MAGSSAFQFGRVAVRAGLVSRRQLASDAIANLRFMWRGSTDADADALRERIGRTIAGMPVRELHRLAPQVLTGILPRLYPRVLALAYAHQDAGRPVYICTAASQEVAELLVRVLGFDGALGSASEVVDGIYTGRPDGPFQYRDGKADAIRELAEREGFDLARCYAYSDSESDLPMLRAVGHPVAVNPDAELARVAGEQGWEVLRSETLGRRVRLLGAAVLAAALCGAGCWTRRAAPRVPSARRALRRASLAGRWPRAARRGRHRSRSRRGRRS